MTILFVELEVVFSSYIVQNQVKVAQAWWGDSVLSLFSRAKFFDSFSVKGKLEVDQIFGILKQIVGILRTFFHFFQPSSSNYLNFVFT